MYKRVSLSGAIGVAVVLVIVWLVANSITAIQNNFQRQIELDTLKQEVALIELANETMRFQNEYYKTDEYVDLQAREQLDKVAPGEKVVILPRSTSKAPMPPQQSTYSTSMQDRSNFEQWFYFLFSSKNQTP